MSYSAFKINGRILMAGNRGGKSEVSGLVRLFAETENGITNEQVDAIIQEFEALSLEDLQGSASKLINKRHDVVRRAYKEVLRKSRETNALAAEDMIRSSQVQIGLWFDVSRALLAVTRSKLDRLQHESSQLEGET